LEEHQLPRNWYKTIEIRGEDPNLEAAIRDIQEGLSLRGRQK
jgi:hypothetical protein